mgnify:CR=1 FL=1
MSRIGKKPITIPANTQVSFENGIFTAKGPLGELRKSMSEDFNVVIENGVLTITPKTDTLESKALWGTYASHMNNMVAGVTNKFTKKLELQGIGYRAEVKGETLALTLGFSHPVNIVIPKTLSVIVEKNVLTISGIDKEEVGSFAAKIRDLKKPEPYKGKGIRYSDEVIRRKQGKKSA